jgi:group I intron endonuclease
MEKVYGIIYKATNIINNKVYIGQTTHSLEDRKGNHVCKAKSPKYYFHESLNKYGQDNFIWEIIDEAYSFEELNEKEKEWIWLYYSNNREHGYNMTEGGEGANGYVFTDEVKLKISKTLTGRKPSKETLEKRSKSLKGKNKGKKHSKEQNEATSLRFKGKKRSAESIEKSSKTRKGYITSEETKLKISKAHIGMKYNDDFKLKCSKNMKGRTPSNKGSRKMIKDGITKQVFKKDIESSIENGWEFYSKK